MTRLVVSLKAEADEAAILEHLQTEAGSRVALTYRDRFRAGYRLLADFPHLGPERPDLGGVRMYVVAPYLVFYRPAGDELTILRILHGRRKLGPALLRL